MGIIEHDIVELCSKKIEFEDHSSKISVLTPAWTTDWMSDATKEKLQTIWHRCTHCIHHVPIGFNLLI
jgi:metal-sulfur cluster biosynthetic enzyme